MDYRLFVFCFFSVMFVVMIGVYGFKFVCKCNFLFGFEWWIVMIFVFNVVIFFVIELLVLYFILYFFDVFLCGFGMLVIVVVGLMVVIYGYWLLIW